MGKAWRVVCVGLLAVACAQPWLLSEGRQVPLGEGSWRPWAELLAAMHRQLHPLFAEQYLRSLESLPASSPLSDRRLVVEVGIQLVPRTGEIRRIAVTRTSGVPEFDAGAVAAFERVRPPPFSEQLASADGYAYLAWQLRRDPDRACLLLQAQPYRLEAKR